ncbi:MAG TPA: OsmC family protein [Chitinophagaceae bacterium]|nr:OsmC family protein [Chitinophagaceae bacterium]
MNIIQMERTRGDFGFDIKDEAGHVVHTDSSPETGGVNYGFRPTQLLLAGLGSCSAIDIIAILKKQKQVINGFKIKIEGEREKNVTPSLWESAHITFELHGPVDTDKATKAAALAMRKYCSVAETLRRGGTKITWTIKISDNKTA